LICHNHAKKVKFTASIIFTARNGADILARTPEYRNFVQKKTIANSGHKATKIHPIASARQL
jgi:hypothetical protein